MYDLLCLATIPDGIQSTPVFTWLDSNGNTITNVLGIMVGTATASSLPLEFGILRASHSGRYTCRATLFSLALRAPLSTSTSISLNVQCKAHYICSTLCYCIFLYTKDATISVNLVSRPVGPEVFAAGPLSLSCQASGGTGLYSYQWSSTCTGGCFLNSRNIITSMVARDAARSADSGLYSCTVTDNAGNNGTNSTQVEVVGM